MVQNYENYNFKLQFSPVLVDCGTNYENWSFVPIHSDSPRNVTGSITVVMTRSCGGSSYIIVNLMYTSEIKPTNQLLL